MTDDFWIGGRSLFWQVTVEHSDVYEQTRRSLSEPQATITQTHHGLKVGKGGGAPLLQTTTVVRNGSKTPCIPPKIS